jgi:hypothetical protein
MIDRQEARSDVARIDPAADRWLAIFVTFILFVAFCNKFCIECTHFYFNLVGGWYWRHL